MLDRIADYIGSAPRVRGADRDDCHLAISDRFSPACAGSSSLEIERTWLSSVQPRVCGEQLWNGTFRLLAHGSAPRVRGAGRLPCHAVACDRFSPACAGSSQSAPKPDQPQAVQPRVCGEQSSRITSSVLGPGSAPRVRGAVVFEYRANLLSRFSPACAGSRRSRLPTAMWSAVQPRVCGEQGVALTGAGTAAGSAPRVRGAGPLLTSETN